MAVVAGLLAVGCSDGGGGTGPTIVDMQFDALVPGQADPVPVALSDYFASNRPGAKIIMINAAAGWCVPCMREASAMTEFAATYEPRGVVILSAVFQNQDGAPADVAFVRAWVESFTLPVPALIDSDFQMDAYVDSGVMPANVFVDADTLEILQVATGADTGDDPMKEYRDLLDYYLQ